MEIPRGELGPNAITLTLVGLEVWSIIGAPKPYEVRLTVPTPVVMIAATRIFLDVVEVRLNTISIIVLLGPKTIPP